MKLEVIFFTFQDLYKAFRGLERVYTVSLGSRGWQPHDAGGRSLHVAWVYPSPSKNFVRLMPISNTFQRKHIQCAFIHWSVLTITAFLLLKWLSANAHCSTPLKLHSAGQWASQTLTKHFKRCTLNYAEWTAHVAQKSLPLCRVPVTKQIINCVL